MNPTVEQREKFLKWCGVVPLVPGCTTVCSIWIDSSKVAVYSEGSRPPLIDLNFLFKYAVPKLIKVIGKLETVALVNNAVCDAVEKGGEIKDSLFWAIYKVI